MAQQLDADDDDHDHAVVVFGGGDRVGSSRGSIVGDRSWGSTKSF